MKKHKNGCNILVMTFTNLEKYVYSKKCSSKVEGISHLATAVIYIIEGANGGYPVLS